MSNFNLKKKRSSEFKSKNKINARIAKKKKLDDLGVTLQNAIKHLAVLSAASERQAGLAGHQILARERTRHSANSCDNSNDSRSRILPASEEFPGQACKLASERERNALKIYNQITYQALLLEPLSFSFSALIELRFNVRFSGLSNAS